MILFGLSGTQTARPHSRISTQSSSPGIDACNPGGSAGELFLLTVALIIDTILSLFWSLPICLTIIRITHTSNQRVDDGLVDGFTKFGHIIKCALISYAHCNGHTSYVTAINPITLTSFPDSLAAA
jgi:hypothetical protein